MRQKGFNNIDQSVLDSGCFTKDGIFTKVDTIRLNMIADVVVRPSQTAFMQGRNILDGVVTLHETVHELHSKKLNGVILKLDFEKAYDKVKWSFLQQTLRMKGFSDKWRVSINSFVSGGSVAIKVMMLADTFRHLKAFDRAILYHQCYLI
jgi:hypothetical protein